MLCYWIYSEGHKLKLKLLKSCLRSCDCSMKRNISHIRKNKSSRTLTSIVTTGGDQVGSEAFTLRTWKSLASLHRSQKRGSNRCSTVSLLNMVTTLHMICRRRHMEMIMNELHCIDLIANTPTILHIYKASYIGCFKIISHSFLDTDSYA